MKKKLALLPTLLILISVFLSACSGLLPLEDEPVTGEFGPQYSPQEHQTRTFDVLWKNLQDTYIYYDTAGVDWDSLHDKYTQQIDAGLSTEEFTALIEDLEAELPEGSFTYQSRAERLEADLADTATYDGIGAFVGFQDEGEPHIVILGVIEESPAAQAGLRAHDSIFSIDGKPISIEEGLSAVSRIRGPAGTTVTLEVQSPGGSKRSVEVERGKLTTSGRLEAYNIVGTNYGYLLFPPISYQGLDQDVFNGLQTLSTNRELQGLILDLRTVNSTTDWPIDTLLTMFHNGRIGELYNRNQEQPLEVKGQDVIGSQTLPLVILVGKHTSGFAEVFAASLQASERAVIVGEQTSGDVETQTAFYLPDGSRLFVQSTSFRLSDGSEIGTTGVTPDVEVDASWDEVLPDKDPVLNAALEVLEKSK